jgi:hypothetical protein
MVPVTPEVKRNAPRAPIAPGGDLPGQQGKNRATRYKKA